HRGGPTVGRHPAGDRQHHADRHVLYCGGRQQYAQGGQDAGRYHDHHHVRVEHLLVRQAWSAHIRGHDHDDERVHGSQQRDHHPVEHGERDIQMMRPKRLRRLPPGQRGFTIIETVMSTALLGIVVLSALGGLLFGMTQARGSQNRAQAATWAEAEMSYLLIQGYGCLSAQTYTLTQATGYHTFGSLTEPTIPASFDHSVIGISAVTGVPVWQVTITVY